jgi:hypothetical protein
MIIKLIVIVMIKKKSKHTILALFRRTSERSFRHRLSRFFNNDIKGTSCWNIKCLIRLYISSLESIIRTDYITLTFYLFFITSDLVVFCCFCFISKGYKLTLSYNDIHNNNHINHLDDNDDAGDSCLYIYNTNNNNNNYNNNSIVIVICFWMVIHEYIYPNICSYKWTA